MSIRWRGGNWTAGNWDASNWLGPNEPAPPGAMSGTSAITFTATGTLSNGAAPAVVVQTPFGGPNRYDLEAKQREALARRIAAEDMNDILLVLSAIAPLLDDERMAA